MQLFRKAVLMEDEGREYYMGEFTQEELDKFFEELTYFTKSDFYVV